MNSKTIKKLDELGRIVLPVEMRNTLGWNMGTKISLILQGNQIILKTDKGNCFLCGNENNIRPVHGKFICENCIDEINK